VTDKKFVLGKITLLTTCPRCGEQVVTVTRGGLSGGAYISDALRGVYGSTPSNNHNPLCYVNNVGYVCSKCDREYGKLQEEMEAMRDGFQLRKEVVTSD